MAYCNLNQAKLSPSNTARSDSFASNAARAGSRSVNSTTAPKRWWHRAIFLTATCLNTKTENSFSFPVKSASHHGQKKIVLRDSENEINEWFKNYQKLLSNLLQNKSPHTWYLIYYWLRDVSQWGSKNRTCPDFEWPTLVFEWCTEGEFLVKKSYELRGS